MLNKIINWARKEDAIRAVLLTGSRVCSDQPDFFADYDITFFVTNVSTYLTDSSWIRAIGRVWVEIADKICTLGQKEYHTRLVIFKGGLKADFAFFTTDILEDIETQGDLLLRFVRAYKVLLDKDGLTKVLRASVLKVPLAQKPTQEEFERVVKEFFFEAYHVAKYFYRNELWQVKFRDWAAKEFLLRMIEWNEKAQHGWDYDTHYQGKKMQSWCNKEIWSVLNNCFARFDLEDSWKALMATIGLFRDVAKQVAEHVDYEYPVSVDKNITDFVQKLLNKYFSKSI